MLSAPVLSLLLGAGQGKVPRGTAAPGADPEGRDQTGTGCGERLLLSALGGGEGRGEGPTPPSAAVAADPRWRDPTPLRCEHAHTGIPAGITGCSCEARRSWGDPREGPGRHLESLPLPSHRPLLFSSRLS